MGATLLTTAYYTLVPFVAMLVFRASPNAAGAADVSFSKFFHTIAYSTAVYIPGCLLYAFAMPFKRLQAALVLCMGAASAYY